MDHGEIGPAFHLRRDQAVGFRVVGAQEFERTLREDDAEAEGRVARVLLEDADAPVRARAREQVGEIQPRRARACDEDVHRLTP